jgi:hypothetical protein
MQRTIRTVFFNYKGETVHTNMAVHHNSAVNRAFSNMALNVYRASVAQVFDTETALLYAEIVRSKSNEVKATWRADPKNHKDPLRMSAQAFFYERQR